ncbi:flagellar biosynthesis protein FlgN [Primorskyibacter aestuariivivens]|uniref:flagellar biosynthesis protein FlgN n=1 Tax=Primorskyibacter aestuariivivens TaxID=1888912 RepID=UPI0023000CFD|nr:flagellar biosynthesis protein FlgN [Primorskyibacter aestuariivivens]MDA7430209.1 flagellar biosynthesis protein FlgN [Primorskyibacter aestuariivivens]
MTEVEIGILDELNDLLDQEKAAILRGDIEAVGRILETKQTLLELLKDMNEPDEGGLDDLRHKLLRNQNLLEHSQRGIQAVFQRISTLRNVQSTLETYDRQGKRRAFRLATGDKVEKRA